MDVAPSTTELPTHAIVGAASLFAVGLASFAPLPAGIAPYSFVVLIPAFLVATMFGTFGLFIGGTLGALVAPIAYLKVVRHVSSTRNVLPSASVRIFGVLFLVSVVYAAFSWDMTVRYTSSTRATALVIQAVVPALLIGIVGYLLREKLTIRGSLVLHWAALAWLAWSAFPWHGELL
jgi:hypothetical protein